ncbi:type I-B CRISPR-associated protein Cas5b [Geobacillus thermodenitrificans]|uniref:Type I-B CRISPR-associated protein Cas5b n=1 Tax=Geobacillus thermodenitrificans TaxID=33940 RepID=A0ABY9QDF8_GEOTD|nr:type I-B CRISPR-associated protein Cas5b [Geobacillus thermodenitrificans]MED3906276.1 type I-B CRISPR-associated protein Cas5b [Geobacillus thermodenitrificans]WMV76578.1 type I-B CRISPR-associated protein Cas5b [Geobacillus thermodenitrificans]
MNVLVFDIRADFGHFRQIYSTSSPLTYSFIPPTALFGLLGAIVGVGKEENEYLQVFNHETTNVAIRLMEPVRKTRVGINYVNTKGNIWVPKQRREGARTQIRVEFLRFPHFRCYVYMKDHERFSQLIDFVRKHKSVYTPCLGLSECLADVRFVTVADFRFVQTINEEPVTICSVIPGKELQTIKVEPGKEYRKERVAWEMNTERVVSCYEEVIFEAGGRPILASVPYYWENEQGERIVFFYSNGKEE